MNLSILFGIKPTGLPHLGHYKCLKEKEISKIGILLADLHALTTKTPAEVDFFMTEIVKFLLAIGLPKENIIIQSKVRGLHSLFIDLLSRTPNSRLRRAHLAQTKKDINGLEYVYPVLMAADLIRLNFFQEVLLGRDQQQHYELASFLARKVGAKLSLPHFTDTIQGTDQRKMSKSYNNVINFSENSLNSILKIKTMSVAKVDVTHLNNTVTSFLRLFEHEDEIRKRYIAGTSFYEEKLRLYDFVDGVYRKLKTLELSNIIWKEIEGNTYLI